MVNSSELAAVGLDWDFEVNIEVLKEKRRADNDARRFKIAIAVLCGIGLGIVGLGVYGLYIDDFKGISGFWIAAGPVFGTIIGYYFGKDGDDP